MNPIAKLLSYRPSVEAALSAIDKKRLKLPALDAVVLFDRFDQHTVTLNELPSGPWSSPLADVVMLAKIALCTAPRKILEVGSYRGYTTKLLAAHTPGDAHIVAFDRDRRHGAAYRDSPLSSKIERRVGEVNIQAFAADRHGSYELIFLDADHVYASVKRDSELLLPLLAPHGIFVWHDYANWGKFSRLNGVPEYLHELSEERVVGAINGTGLAAHSPAWATGDGALRFKASIQTARAALPGEDPWTVEKLRG